MEIDERDLLNMLRHAFMFGANVGMSIESIEDVDPDERDYALHELIAAQKSEGSTKCDNEPEGEHQLSE